MGIDLECIQTFVNFVNTTNTGYGLINVDDLLDLKDVECNPIVAKLGRITENLKSEIEGMIDEELAQPLNLGECNTFKTIRECMAYYRKVRKQKEKQEGMSTK